jgi:hypothetical protein
VKLALLMMVASAGVAAEPVSFTSFEIPGATSYFVAGINDEGLVAGTWFAADGSEVGFVRALDGRICTPLVPGAAATFAQGINNDGHIVGRYATADGVEHAFVSGRFTAASCL